MKLFVHPAGSPGEVHLHDRACGGRGCQIIQRAKSVLFPNPRGCTDRADDRLRVGHRLAGGCHGGNRELAFFAVETLQLPGPARPHRVTEVVFEPDRAILGRHELLEPHVMLERRGDRRVSFWRQQESAQQSRAQGHVIQVGRPAVIGHRAVGQQHERERRRPAIAVLVEIAVEPQAAAAEQVVRRHQLTGKIDAGIGRRKLLELGHVGGRIGVGGDARDTRGQQAQPESDTRRARTDKSAHASTSVRLRVESPNRSTSTSIRWAIVISRLLMRAFASTGEWQMPISAFS